MCVMNVQVVTGKQTEICKSPSINHRLIVRRVTQTNELQFSISIKIDYSARFEEVGTAMNEWSVPDKIPLDREKEVTFGRGNISTIMLHSPLLRGHLSRKHASIRFNKETAAWEICDLQSVNGVAVNGNALTPGRWTSIALGDIVCFGVNIDQNELKYALVEDPNEQGLLVKCRASSNASKLSPPRKKARICSERNDCLDLTQDVNCAPPRVQPQLDQPLPPPPLLPSAAPHSGIQPLSSAVAAAFDHVNPIASHPHPSACTTLPNCSAVELKGNKAPEVLAPSAQPLQERLHLSLPVSSEVTTSTHEREPKKDESHDSIQQDKEKEELLLRIAALKEQLEMKERSKVTSTESGDNGESKPHDNSVITSMEEEFTCCICQELFVRAHTLSCAHSFCEVCIKEWMKTKKECPICRKAFSSSPVHSLALDNAISKIVDKLGPESKATREALVASRAEALCPSTTSGGTTLVAAGGTTTMAAPSHSRRQSLRSRGSRDFPIDIELHVGVDDDEEDDDSDDSDDDSDDYEDGHPGAYYGGYGRCYNCGRRGHWSNGCPERW